MLSFFKLARLLPIVILAAGSAACEEDLGLDDWSDTPDTTVIYSLSRPDLLGQPSAYDFINHVVLRVESPNAPGNWDVAVRHEGNALALVPAGGFEGQTSRAGLALITGTTFEELAEAPEDTAAFSDAAVLVQPGQVLAVRTRRAPCAFSNSVRYGKVRIIDVDPVAGTVRFASVVNPFCNDRSLVPPED
ncbi:MAG TPA: hypothetical protein VGD27_08860 [Longimicrobiales bacterium]